MDGELPIAGQGAPEATGVYHDQAQTPLVQPGSQGQPRRKAPPPPVKLPGAQDASCAVGDARLIYERRQMPAQRLNDHLRNNGMCSASSRDYAVGLGRKQIAQDEARAAASDEDDFLKVCPGAAKIDVLGPSAPSGRSAPAKKQLGQDVSTVWTWQFNPLTNALEQVPVRRDAFKR